MTKHIMTLNDDLREWLCEGDVCVVARWFRDVLDTFEDLGLEPKMPSFLNKGTPQHTVEEENTSRLVTKVWWVVEAYHGRIKKFFDNTGIIEQAQIPLLGTLNRVVTAALNAFRPPLITTTDDDHALAERMLQSSQVSMNKLAERVQLGVFVKSRKMEVP